MLALTPEGASLREETRQRTQTELETFVERLDPTARVGVIEALRALQVAFLDEPTAGERSTSAPATGVRFDGGAFDGGVPPHQNTATQGATSEEQT